MISEESERRLFARARELTEAAMQRVERHRLDIAERDRERAAAGREPAPKSEAERFPGDLDRPAG
jgi:hypothetical protein